jgi:hypothetical protein
MEASTQPELPFGHIPLFGRPTGQDLGVFLGMIWGIPRAVYRLTTILWFRSISSNQLAGVRLDAICSKVLLSVFSAWCWYKVDHTSSNHYVSFQRFTALEDNASNSGSFILVVFDYATSPGDGNTTPFDLAKEHVEKLYAALHEPDSRSLAAFQSFWVIELRWSRSYSDKKSGFDTSLRP